jgi:hypothetical protein
MGIILTFLIESFIFVASATVSAFATGSIMLPIFYGIPKAFAGFIRRKLYFKAVLMYLLAPITWILGLLILSVLMASLLPSIYNYLLQYSTGFYLGNLLGFWGVILKSLLSKKSRTDNKAEYDRFVERYRVKL